MDKKVPVPQYTSPASTLPVYELKMMQEYLHGLNLQRLGEAIPTQRKNMMLTQFFKHKRYQQVLIKWKKSTLNVVTSGKVDLVGRDFVMLTSLFNRYWFPYHSIDSTDIPAGLPNLSSHSHQHIVFDDRLRKQLTTQFGRTVGKRDELMRQFYEPSWMGHLKLWEGSTLHIITTNDTYDGRLSSVNKTNLYIRNRSKQTKQTLIPLNEVICIRLIRPLTGLNLFHRLKQ
ncbi:MAG TPA: hypothetical protein VGI33_07200 [Paenibacillus sp.]|jgi:hypothetical protein